MGIQHLHLHLGQMVDDKFHTHWCITNNKSSENCMCYRYGLDVADMEREHKINKELKDCFVKLDIMYKHDIKSNDSINNILMCMLIISMIMENGHIARKIKTEFYDIFDESKLSESVASGLTSLFHQQVKIQDVLENLYANRD